MRTRHEARTLRLTQQHQSARRRREWWRRQRRSWRQTIRAWLPRADLTGLS